MFETRGARFGFLLSIIYLLVVLFITFSNYMKFQHGQGDAGYSRHNLFSTLESNAKFSENDASYEYRYRAITLTHESKVLKNVIGIYSPPLNRFFINDAYENYLQQRSEIMKHYWWKVPLSILALWLIPIIVLIYSWKVIKKIYQWIMQS